MPTAFIPTEDKGYFAVAVQLPDAASLQRTQAVVHRVEGFLHEEPAVVNIVALAGLDILTRTNQTNSATIFVTAQALGRARHERIHRRHHRTHQRQAVRHEGRRRLRVQPSRDPRARRHVRRRDEPAEPLGSRRARLRPVGAGVPGGGQPAARRSGDDHDIPRQRAAALRERGPSDREGARREADGSVRHACRRCCPRSTSTTSTCTAGPTGCRPRRSRSSARARKTSAGSMSAGAPTR